MKKTDVLIFGDICPTQDYRIFWDNRTILSDDIKKEIGNAILTVSNLEAPATDIEASIKKCGPSLKALPTDIDYLKSIGFTALSLANNHILDHGAQGVIDTLNKTSKIGITTFGADLNAQKARAAKYFDNNGIKIGFLSFAEHEFNLAKENDPGANGFDPLTSLKDIREAKALCDFLIILYHGGIEHYKYPSPLLQLKCRTMADEGADVILCQHSHCIGTYETYNESFILYGQGNSVFGYRGSNNTWNKGLIVSINFNEEKRPHISFRLIKATCNGIGFADIEEEKKRLSEIEQDSMDVYDPEFILTEWKCFIKENTALYLPLLYGWNKIYNKANRLLKNIPAKLLIGRKARMITGNLINCDTHREVITSILNKDNQ